MKTIKDNEELKNYIKNGSIVFNESIKCDFNINVDANIKACNIEASNINAYDIKAWNIKAYDIKALNIKARDINAYNIDAYDISYYAFCIAYGSIKCKSIKGRRGNNIFKCLDREITYKEETKTIEIDGKKIELSLESFEALKNSLTK
jgi:hypothetical protein